MAGQSGAGSSQRPTAFFLLRVALMMLRCARCAAAFILGILVELNENKPLLLVEIRDRESVSLIMPRLLILSSFVVLVSSWNAFAFHPASRLSLPNKYCSQSRNANRFGHHLLTRRTKPSGDDDDDVDNLFFDDFGGDFVGSDGPAASSSSFSSSLSERIEEQRLGEERTAAKLAKNWKTGNWGVRGFILDSSDPIRESMADATASAENADVGGGSAPRLGGGGDMSSTNADSEIPPIHVSTIVGDQSHMYDEGYESEKIDKIVVGRTDGSVLIVKMGTAYMTQFTAVPKLRLDDSSSWDSNNDVSPASADQDTASSDGPSVRVETELMNSEDVVGEIGDGNEVNNMQYPMEDPFDALYGAGNANAGQEPMQSQAMEGTPFEILHQFSAHENEPITALLFINDIVFSAAGVSGEIRTWSMPEEDGNNSESKMIPGKTLSGAHSDRIVALKALSSSPDSIEPDLLLSASRDGSFALWDLNSGDLVTRCQMLTETSEPESIMCADVDASGVDGDVIYFGLSSGYVNCYFVNDVIIGASAGGVCPLPSSRFQAHDGVGGVTAILAAGQGTSISSNLQQQARPTSILLTGGTDGLVKQW